MPDNPFHIWSMAASIAQRDDVPRPSSPQKPLLFRMHRPNMDSSSSSSLPPRNGLAFNPFRFSSLSSLSSVNTPTISPPSNGRVRNPFWTFRPPSPSSDHSLGTLHVPCTSSISDTCPSKIPWVSSLSCISSSRSDSPVSSVSSAKPTSVVSHVLPPLPAQIDSPDSSYPSGSTQRSPVDPSHLSSRRPHKDNEITPSDLRPTVFAKHWIKDRETPWSLRNKEYYQSKFPAEFSKFNDKVIRDATVEVTKETYGAGLTRFTQFCDKYKEDRMPADKYLVSAFIGSHLGTISGKTASNSLSGLKAWHDAKLAPWCGNERLIQQARIAATKDSVHLKREPRYPITIRHLIALRKALDLSIPFHAAIWAAALTTFWACRRLGETTVPSESKFDPKFHVTLGTVFRWHQLDNGAKAVSLHIPWTKTTHGNGADITVSSLLNDPDGICGLAALSNHLQINKDVPDNFSLFAYIGDDGKATSHG
ncbi:hypothetical protein D9758_004720 [Tetrapyrgos nigripes]|uniref:Uncharacterized protein n=1 Tax=Tetrapyrgos nigripes TaxID=182062 RepID=A0A8H5LYN7_9AGAR|nr:hypothetical protein D9758_004720 [Tetrapyrgos nigripes]